MAAPAATRTRPRVPYSDRMGDRRALRCDTGLARARALRCVRRGGYVALASLLGYVLIGLPFIVFPSVEPVPKHADAVFVLGPISATRVAAAEKLLADGVVDAMLWSIPEESRVPGDRYHDLVAPCGVDPDLTCRYAQPTTTQGEARMLRDVAAEHGWKSVIVITQTSHLVRASMILGRCYPGTIVMEPSGEPPYSSWPFQYAYQTVATVKAWLNPGC